MRRYSAWALARHGLSGAEWPRAFGAAFRSSVARVVAEIVRDDVGDRPADRSYLIHCEGSSGQYLADALLDAGREFGLITVPTGTDRSHGCPRS